LTLTPAASAQATTNTTLEICLGKNGPGPNFCDIGDDEISLSNNTAGNDNGAHIFNTFGSSAAARK